uniref:Uncharacterized protein n=1 Tax=Anguilla anguilla TaxID=7936 RepID=A0A0E9XR44_ANGAN
MRGHLMAGKLAGLQPSMNGDCCSHRECDGEYT